MATLRHHLGVVLLDLPSVLWHLSRKGGWARVHNRLDDVEPDPLGRGLRIRAPFSSRLHACDVYPSLGRALLRAAAREWPIMTADSLGDCSSTPDVSAVIAFRGSDRRGPLEAVLRTLAASQDVKTEVVIVEQSENHTLTDLPPGPQCIHLPHPDGNTGWHKSWAYNVGARHARAEIMVFHDADIGVPAGYLREIVNRLGDGEAEVAVLQRLLFDLDQTTTRTVQQDWANLQTATVEAVRQNWTGGTIAIRREAFEAVGGFDEAFVDWSGEDTDFFDRATTRSSLLHGYIPFVHLWHPPQRGKAAIKAMPVEHDLSMKRRSIPPAERIGELRERRWGQDTGPSAAAYE